MPRTIVAVLIALALASRDVEAQGRCAAGEVALPIDTTWVAAQMPGLPPGREGCVVTRPEDQEVAGRIVFRATPKGTPGIDDYPHPRLLEETMRGLARANIRIDEPKWRKMSLPFSGAGMEGFGNGTVFGFDGLPIEGDGSWDIIVLVFDGPAFHYDLTLISISEVLAPAEYKLNTDGMLAVMRGLSRVSRTPRP
jgi:hypothetical protein